MPGIRIYRKSKLKTANTEKTVIAEQIEVSPGDDLSNNISTPDISSTEPQPYVIDGDDLDIVGDNFYKDYPSDKKGNQKIFVQIAAYRDPELIPTLVSMIDNADEPDNLTFGICWQHNQNDEFDQKIYEYMKDDRFQIIDVKNKRGHGTCWARHTIQHLYCEEEFTLAIDSHHRFVPGWDSKLKSMYYYLQQKGHPKPLLTGYVTSYKPWLENSDGTGEYSMENGFETEPWKMVFDRFIPEGAIFFLPTSMTGSELKEPIPSRFYSAHFIFSTGQMCNEVPHDPNYYFHGEEISLAVRAFTHGYDLFHPNKIIAYHEYTRKGRPHHWDDCNKEQGRQHDWWEVNEMCHKRNRILFGMDGEDSNQINFGEYGFGNERTVEEYERYAGINFKKRAITQDVVDSVNPVYPHNGTEPDDIEWLKNWCIDFFIPWDDLPETYEDTEFWYVGVHDADGNELVREDYQIEKIQEIYDERQDPHAARFPIGLVCKERPVSYTVIPFVKDHGWLDKIVKDLDPNLK